MIYLSSPPLLSLLFTISFLLPSKVSPLILPPAQKLAMGLEDELKSDCLSISDSHTNIYASSVSHGYQVGATVFTSMSKSGSTPLRIFLPAFPNNAGELEKLADLLCTNWEALGGIDCAVRHWPETPASCLEINWSFRTPSMSLYSRESEETIKGQVEDTESYVDQTLATLGLCPFTKSMSRSALGLESVGVQPGPVVIRHSGDIKASPETTPATVLASLYWEGVTELIEKPETEAATFLLVAPTEKYSNFKSFFTDCDTIIEKTNFLAPGAMGRVWFHPNYRLSEVGYQSGGHAPPLSEVDSLMDLYIESHPGAKRPGREDTERAHDITRWTPWPTINLLRPKQLEKAKENDKKERRAKVYPRNVVRILEAEEKGELEELIKCPFGFKGNKK